MGVGCRYEVRKVGYTKLFECFKTIIYIIYTNETVNHYWKKLRLNFLSLRKKLSSVKHVLMNFD